MPTDRLRLALAELAAALGESEAAEVEGFRAGHEGEIDCLRSLSFDSLGLRGSTGSIAPKIGSSYSEDMLKTTKYKI